MQVITTTSALSKACKAMAGDAFVTVDTEFMRERTYWAKLCLIQIAGEHVQAIIDPLAEGLDLAPFFELMANENVIKVFHAARQDLEIFQHIDGRLPHPLFDTQVAAMCCGFGDQIGYEPLARQLTGAKIDKSSRFTDWSRRPLSDKQLDYALSDVTHLRGVYEKLAAMLEKSGRAGWLDEEMEILTDPATYRTEPEDAWKRIRFRPQKKAQLGVLMEVAAWREREAQKRDVPRGRIIKDDAIGELALQAPKDVAALSRLRAVPKGFGGSRNGEAVIAAIQTGLERDPGTIPEIRNHHRRKPEGVAEISEILKLALKIICEQEGIAQRLVANAADIEAIAAGKTKGIKALSGWRYKLFGEKALKLRNGDLAIGLRGGKAAIFELERECEKLKAAE